MNPDKIKQWISFAKKNGYVFRDKVFKNRYGDDCDFYIEDNYIVITADIGKHGTNEILNELNLIEVITSKPFIEAVARGVLSKMRWEKDKEYYYNVHNETIFYTDCECIDGITVKQVFAIRDNTLEDFIETIIGIDN